MASVRNRGSQVVLEMKINLASANFAEEGEFARRTGTFKLSDANVTDAKQQQSGFVVQLVVLISSSEVRISLSRGTKERLVPEEGLSRDPCALLPFCLRLRLRLCPTRVGSRHFFLLRVCVCPHTSCQLEGR